MDFNLIGFKSAEIKAPFRDNTAVTAVTVNIRGTLHSNTHPILHGILSKTINFGSAVFTGFNLPVDSPTNTSINGGSFRIQQIMEFYTNGGIGTTVNGYYKESPGFVHMPKYIVSIASASNPAVFNYIDLEKHLVTTSMEIDWFATLASIRTGFPSSVYTILGWAWSGVTVEDLVLVNGNYSGMVNSSGGWKIVDDNITTMKDVMLNRMQQAHKINSEPTYGVKDYLGASRMFRINYAEDGTPSYDLGENISPSAVKVQVSSGMVYQEGWYIDFPGTIIVYVIPTASLSTSNIWVVPNSVLGGNSPDNSAVDTTLGNGGSGDSKTSGTGCTYDVKGTLNTPPTVHATGDKWVVGTNPTGAWAGRAGQIATWNGTGWTFTTPEKNDSYYDQTTDKKYTRDGASWNEQDVENGGNLSRTGVVGGSNNTGNVNAAGGGFAAFADSAGMTIGQYNNFVSAGGGFITENGLFPNSDEYYIEEINLSMSGSTMRVVQVSKFDATAYLTDGDRIYGYVLNEDGDVQPVFAGFIKSHSRTFTDKNQEIVYECADLKDYLDQFYTPLLYKHSNWSVKSVAQDLLLQAGVRFQSNLPDDLFIDVDYQAEVIPSVLDYLCQISGDFYYWIDRNGDLILDEFRDTTHSFIVPSEGTPVVKGTHEVRSFNPVTDLSNSRSRIVVSGGVGTKIYEGSGNSGFSFYGNTGQQWNSLDAAFAAGACGQVLVKGSNRSNPSLYIVTKVTNAEPVSELYGGENHTGRPLQAIYTKADKAGYPSHPVSTYMSVSSSSKIVNGVYCAFFSVGSWSVLTHEIQNETPGLWSIPAEIEFLSHGVQFEIAYKTINDPFVYIINTGNPGGTLVFNEGGAKWVHGRQYSVDDSWILRYIANNLAQYYAPTYGGELVLDGLHNEIQIGDKISLTNTTLPTLESTSLKVKGIIYKLSTKETVITLADRLNVTNTGTSADIMRANKNFYQSKLNSAVRTKVNHKILY